MLLRYHRYPEISEPLKGAFRHLRLLKRAESFNVWPCPQRVHTNEEKSRTNDSEDSVQYIAVT